MKPSKTLSIFLFANLLVACAAGNPERDSGPETPPGDAGDVVMMEDGGTVLPGTDSGLPPRDGSTCATSDECTLDTQRCAGDLVETCELDTTSGCTVWGEAAECGGGLFCSGDECTDTCAAAPCTDGERVCTASGGFQVCETQDSGCLGYSPEEMCPADQTCMGAGACMVCTDGATRCGPLGEVQECVAGRWTLVEGCPFGCMTGACVESVECLAGAYRCRGNNVEACNSSGSAWLHIRTCAVACGGAGLCNGVCEPGTTRCNGLTVETCNAAGTAWDNTETCTTYCASGSCALNGLDLLTSMALDGEVFIDGQLRVRLNSILSSPSGNLTIHADSIVVDEGGSISVAPTGDGPGAGGNGTAYYYRGGGGSYGTSGGSPGTGSNGSTYGYTTDAEVAAGSRGGYGFNSGSGLVTTSAGLGGGVLRLFANTITINGTITANGAVGSAATGSSSLYSGGGGGSGGGILIAGTDVTIGSAASISARGSLGGPGYNVNYNGSAGGNGRVKILYGATLDEMGSIEGVVTRGYLPPVEIASTTHPDPSLWYNDGFPVVGMSWTRPFSPIQGYYWRHHTGATPQVPAPGMGTLALGEIVSFPVEGLTSGANFFRIVSVTPTSDVGTVAGSFQIQINRNPPTLSSTSHASQTTWVDVPDVFMRWTYPQADENFQGIHYVFDHYGDTIPTVSDNFVPVTQKQQLLAGVADGIWFFHAVSVDTQGYLNQTARHYQVRIGENPGNGSVSGDITNAATGSGIEGARVDINRGIVPSQTTVGRSFNFSSVPAGTWELRVTANGYVPATMMVTVNADMPTLANMTLTPMPAP